MMAARSTPWQALSPRETLAALEASEQGLTAEEAARRLRRYGPNHFQRAPPVPAWRVLLAQFRGVIVLLLVGAALVALATGDSLDAAAIGGVLALNVTIGFATELRAHRSMEALVALDVARARVRRDGALRTIDARALVPGDVIELAEGQQVPADARLLTAAELRTAESALTGEAEPVEKDAGAAVDPDAVVAERVTMVYKATTVVGGRARAVVTATGMTTEVGRIGALASSVRQRQTPLERRLEQLGRRLAIAALAVAVVVAGTAWLQGMPLGLLLQTTLALAVAAVPEGLPVVGTIAMAVGVRRMARRHALIRRLPAVETLGSTTVVCSDKTGTLTSGEMALTAVRLPNIELEVRDGRFLMGGSPVDPASHHGLALLLRTAALASRSDAREFGDPTEVALAVAAHEAGLDLTRLRAEWPEVGEVPFSSARRLMATFHGREGTLVACVKGAPGRVLDLSDSVRSSEGDRPLDAAGREALLEANDALARRGLRVLAIATGTVARAHEAALGGLTFLGFVGLSDPPAAGVTDTIRAFGRAGLRTVMLTGDQRRTAEAIGAALGLLEPGRSALDGREVDRLDDEALARAASQTTVFSRVSPEGKLRIVGAYQRGGEIVAMLGDGVNDAAALRQADIGVAMGLRGTDVAKESADVILADDRFPTIAAAVEEGRVVFENLQKFVFYLFSCNLAEILVLLGAGLLGVPAVLHPLQILWLNLLTDTFPALALAVEPAEPGTMRRPPRDPRAPILSARAVRASVGFAALIALVTLAALAGGRWTGGDSVGTTMAFMTLAFAQIFHLGNARREGPVLRPAVALRNRAALAAVGLAGGLQLLTLAPASLAELLRVAPLSGREWAFVALLSLIPGAAGQLLKLGRDHRRAGGPA